MCIYTCLTRAKAAQSKQMFKCIRLRNIHRIKSREKKNPKKKTHTKNKTTIQASEENILYTNPRRIAEAKNKIKRVAPDETDKPFIAVPSMSRH